MLKPMVLILVGGPIFVGYPVFIDFDCDKKKYEGIIVQDRLCLFYDVETIVSLTWYFVSVYWKRNQSRFTRNC